MVGRVTVLPWLVGVEVDLFWVGRLCEAWSTGTILGDVIRLEFDNIFCRLESWLAV